MRGRVLRLSILHGAPVKRLSPTIRARTVCPGGGRQRGRLWRFRACESSHQVATAGMTAILPSIKYSSRCPPLSTGEPAAVWREPDGSGGVIGATRVGRGYASRPLEPLCMATGQVIFGIPGRTSARAMLTNCGTPAIRRSDKRHRLEPSFEFSHDA